MLSHDKYEHLKFYPKIWLNSSELVTKILWVIIKSRNEQLQKKLKVHELENELVGAILHVICVDMELREEFLMLLLDQFKLPQE